MCLQGTLSHVTWANQAVLYHCTDCGHFWTHPERRTQPQALPGGAGSAQSLEVGRVENAADGKLKGRG